MFANDKSINTLQELFSEIKKYFILKGQYFKLDMVEKLTILLSTLILILVLLVLGTMALFYLSFMLVYVVASALGSLIGAYAIVGIALIIVALVIYRMRHLFIVRPMAAFLAKLFLEEQTNEYKP